MIDFEIERWQHCYFERGTRWYLATLQQDLFGGWLLKREWGSLERNWSRSLTMPTASYEDALKLLAATIKRRQQRNYREK